MFQKIIVPVDLTDRHSPALNVVSQMASEAEGEVVVLHVIEMLHGLSREEDPAFYRRLEAKAKEHVGRLVDVLRQKKVKARGEVLYGNRVGEIVGFARREGMDLIVLMSHAVDLTQPGTGWSTLSHQIGLLAACPVLLVK